MRTNLILTLILGFSISFSAISQTGHWCGLENSDMLREKLVKNKAKWGDTYKKGKVERFVPVTIHRVGKNNGTGSISEEEVYSSICTLNERHEALGTEFRFFIHAMNEVNNSEYSVHPQRNGARLRNLANRSEHRNSLNLFVVDDIRSRNPDANLPGEPDSVSVIAGYYTRGFDYIVVRQQNMADATFTLEHEIGHFFTLMHTHNGWEQFPYQATEDGEKVEILTVESNQTGATVRVELMDGSNCEIAGDNICDTPPDYGFGQACSCCRMNYVVLDRNCDTIRPMLNNIMAYSERCSDWIFSPDQITAMQTDYDTRNELLAGAEDVTEYTPIKGQVTLVAPGRPGAVDRVDIYDEVFFDWEDVPEAEFYILNINGESQVVEESELTVTTLNPGAINSWSVKAYNKFGGGCFGSTEIAFLTGTGSVSVSDIEQIESIQLVPNPVTLNDELRLSFSSSESMNGQLKMLDLSGKVFYEKELSVKAGFNLINISTQGFQSGLYILYMETSHGTLTQKVIIK